MKRRLDDLAVFGGRPAFPEPLHVGRPNLGSRERLFGRLQEALDRNWLTNDGPFVREFERHVATLTGSAHCVAMSNTTAALEVLLRALDLSGEVVVPSFTFIATVHVLQWLGLRPVFADVDLLTHNLDPADVERRMTSRTAAILGVHIWGRPCAIDALEDLARRRGIPLLFDAAHAFGCTFRGRPLGSFGTAEVFSFHATKFVNTFEGGAVTTNDEALAHRLRIMRNFGFSGYDLVTTLGINAKMSEPSAAMGLTSIESMPSFLAVNAERYQTYADELDGLEGIRLVRYDEQERNNRQFVVVEVFEDQDRVARDDVHRVLWAEGVRARRYFFPGCHAMEPYRSTMPEAGASLPATKALVKRTLCLPTGTGTTIEDVRAVCQILRFCLEHARAVRQQLDATPENQRAAFVPMKGAH